MNVLVLKIVGGQTQPVVAAQLKQSFAVLVFHTSGAWPQARWPGLVIAAPILALKFPKPFKYKFKILSVL